MQGYLGGSAVDVVIDDVDLDIIKPKNDTDSCLSH